MSRRPIVVSIAGVGRSGSTLLERVLGTLPGVAAIGEIVHLAERGAGEDQACGCGQPFAECPFWTEVGERAFGGWSKFDAADIHALARSVDRHRYLPSLIWPRGSFRDRLGKYAAYLDAVYSAVADVSGASVIVDSSKHPSHSYVLRHAPGVDLRVVLMTRDPRGVASSWQKVVRRPEVTDREQMMPRYGPARVAVRWDSWNLLGHGLGLAGAPLLRLRYEDLVADPRGEIARVGAFAGVTLDADALDFIHDADGATTADLAVIHSVAGNPMRFDRGPVRIALDDAWRSQLPARQRATVSAITAPLRWWYGYTGARS